jgi:kynurenine formamidase
LDPTKSADELESHSPGIGIAGAQWLADRDTALVGADNFGVEAFPTEDPEAHVPVHLLLLREYGIHLIELLDLEALAESGAREFLFSLSVMPIRGGINSPVNPLAIT